MAAAAVIRNHVRRCKTPGNKKPKLTTKRGDRNAGQRVGGAVGMTFDNAALGK